MSSGLMKIMPDNFLADNPKTAEGYETFLRDLKDRIRAAQVRAALTVNHELIQLYWQIGHDLVTRQKTEGWGEAGYPPTCG